MPLWGNFNNDSLKKIKFAGCGQFSGRYPNSHSIFEDSVIPYPIMQNLSGCSSIPHPSYILWGGSMFIYIYQWKHNAEVKSNHKGGEKKIQKGKLDPSYLPP